MISTKYIKKHFGIIYKSKWAIKEKTTRIPTNIVCLFTMSGTNQITK